MPKPPTRRPSGSPRPRARRKPPRATPRLQPLRSTYIEAVGLYERAIRAVQQHRYEDAAALLRRVIADFPDERELLDRVRLYLGLCERHITPPAAEPQTVQERLYAATLALNAGDAAGAARHLDRVRREDPRNDQALYLLAVAHTQRGEAETAIGYLEQAIAANVENRARARLDPDLQALRSLRAAARVLGR